MKSRDWTFVRFCLVGTIGFIVDAGATLVLVTYFGLSPATARIIAFLVAASVTWFLNKQFTFRAAGLRSWAPYVVLTATGALVNVSIYLLWIAWAGAGKVQIVIGIALGSGTALCLNYVVSKHVIFGNRLRRT